MTNELFLLLLLVCFAAILLWGFRVLPGEKWQILATLPVRRNSNGEWQGLNLTWYGLLTANAYLVAVAMLVLLLGTIGIPLGVILLTATCLLAVCVPASKLVARIVEGKAHTFTVGGAVFVGLLAAPWLIEILNRLPGTTRLPVLPAMAAIAIAYAFGEGLGRLACISFGCCYGKPLSQCRPIIRGIFRHWSFAFVGATKKIAYASGLEGERVVPVQGITAILYVLTGLAGVELFLNGHFGGAFVLATLVTQGWRICSETIRSDYRGGQGFSVYQKMALLAIPYSLIVALGYYNTTHAVLPELKQGLDLFWQPAPLIFFQLLWLTLFWYTGRSSVTGATLSFHVHHDRI